MLAEDKYASQIDWSKVYLFWGDERMVPVNHKDSNYLMAKEALIDHVPVPAQQVFPMVVGDSFSENDIENYAQQYTENLHKYLDITASGLPKFDLIMLGMGDDGHTASLFPHTDILNEEKKAVAKVYVDKLKSWRISLTYPVLETCADILIMACGDNKASVLKKIFNKELSVNDLPMSRIAFLESANWYTDKAAITEIEAGN
jgi:6-phosphogluconolactonase